jgi:hypothetical protein
MATYCGSKNVARITVYTLYFLWSFIGSVSEWVINGISEFSTRMRVSTERYTAVLTVGFLLTCLVHEPKALVLVQRAE